MYNVEFPELPTNLAELLRHVLLGEEVIISQAGTPIARIVPIGRESLPRILGLDKGKVIIAPDFDAPLPEDILNSFLNPADERESAPRTLRDGASCLSILVS
jgi:prevent-host-death family protein